MLRVNEGNSIVALNLSSGKRSRIRESSEKLTSMSNKKHYLTALIFVGLALSVAPALADPVTPVTVSNVQVDWTQGEGTTMSSPAGSVYYAGPILFTIDGTQNVVWCDDLYNDVYIGSSDQYYETDAHDANAYLYNPSLTPALQTTIDQDIAGLAYEGTLLAQADALTSTSGAEYQAAIWEVEYQGLTNTDSTFQSGVQGYIDLASADYSAMVNAGYTYGELESPGCVTQGALTYMNICQTQGQLVVHDNAVPEPSSLAVLLAGLTAVGCAFYLTRKKALTA